MKNCYSPSCVINRGKLVEGISSTDKSLLTMHSRPVWETVVHRGVSDAHSSEPVLYTPLMPQASVVPASFLATGGTQPVLGKGAACTQLPLVTCMQLPLVICYDTTCISLPLPRCSREFLSEHPFSFTAEIVKIYVFL